MSAKASAGGRGTAARRGRHGVGLWWVLLRPALYQFDDGLCHVGSTITGCYGYLACSGRMPCFGHRQRGRWASV